MIAKMKKVSLVVLDAARERSLESLRKIGALHVAPGSVAEGKEQALADLEGRRAVVRRALNLLDVDVDAAPQVDVEDAFSVAAEVVGHFEREQELAEETGRLERERSALAPWGSFDPASVGELSARGVNIGLYHMSRADLAELPEGVTAIPVQESKASVRMAVLSVGVAPQVPGVPFPMPSRGLARVEAEIERVAEEMGGARRARRERAGASHSLQRLLGDLESAITFERVRLGMAGHGALASLVGYVPVDRVDELAGACAEGGWALLVEDPGEDEPVPTLIRNSRFVEIIRPVFNFLGIVPGYTEYDISFWFLAFFSVFWAMIIGDAGYGLLFLGIALALGGRLRSKSPQFFGLLLLTSICTIVWGALTGTWFGSEALAALAPLRMLTANGIASYPLGDVDVQGNVMAVCFVIGAVHITVAHVKNFVARLPRPVALAEIGWLGVLWGMYFAIQFVVLGKDLSSAASAWVPGVSIGSAAAWLVGGGMVLVILFAEQKGRLLRGFAVGLATTPLKLLDSISVFSHVVSYVRLFAVGLASVKVAAAFNVMAASIGPALPAGIGAAFILFFGHALNIAMGAMSLLVHGVRLNVLEFSNHLGMEWKGTPYAPFSEEQR